MNQCKGPIVAGCLSRAQPQRLDPMNRFLCPVIVGIRSPSKHGCRSVRHCYSAIRNQCHSGYFRTHMSPGRTGRGLNMALLDKIKPQNKRAIAFSVTVYLFSLIFALRRIREGCMQTYDRLAGICVCAKIFRMTLTSDSTLHPSHSR
jgi:hypothetical protein